MALRFAVIYVGSMFLMAVTSACVDNLYQAIEEPPCRVNSDCGDG